MNVAILDNEALRAISPIALAAYARTEGWRKTEPYGPHADVYEAPGKPEIILPRTDRLGDYPTVVSKLIAVFAKAAECDELITYRNLIGSACDVIRTRSFGNEDDGSVSLDAGVQLVTNARQMLHAAACSVASPQPVYRMGANKDASDYMQRVRLAQTEYGSFVVALLAPVPPDLQMPLEAILRGSAEEEPFERRVTHRLMTAVESARDAVELATSGAGVDAFEKVVKEGVSANLCEAIAGLIEYSGKLEISLTWAKTRPAREVQRKIAFSGNEAAPLREAARIFRARNPRPDVMLYGTVYQLKRDQDEFDGSVTLKAFVDERVQSVRAVLNESDYSIALQANHTKTPISVKGDLERIGQRWHLANASIAMHETDIGVDDTAN